MVGVTLGSLRVEALHRARPSHIGKNYSLADFVPKAKIDKLHRQNLQRSTEKKKFDVIDQFCAEIIARFGYQVYEKWNKGEISDGKIVAWLAAEQAREGAKIAHIEAVILNSVSATIRLRKHEKKPKGIERAASLIKALIASTKGRS